MTAVNLMKFIRFALGSLVRSSLMILRPIKPIPATRPVMVAASIIDFTSLLSDMVRYTQGFSSSLLLCNHNSCSARGCRSSRRIHSRRRCRCVREV